MNPSLRRRLLFGLRLVITVAVAAWLVSGLDLDIARQALREAPAWVFVVPPAFMTFNALIHAVRLRLLTQAIGAPVSIGTALSALFRASFAGLALPTGGSELAKIGFLAQDIPSEKAVVALTVGRLQDMLPWAALLLYGLTTELRHEDPALAGVAVFFALAFLGATSVVWLAAGRSWRLGAWVERASHALLQLRGQPRVLALSLGLCLPFALVNVTCSWLVVRGFGVDMAWLDALARIPAADCLISLPITISGVGVREGVFAHLLSPWGVAATTAALIGTVRWTGELFRAALGGVLFVLR
ncbi:MAG: flippase-like domain-containing protein [Proteobacteria bacterium]|nr:flippase-like domain-containing protein [Pseudomonadota bacterium]MCP4917500.1 flippase-like domain-containing protein [Pseudomonadota bacterium]